MRRDRPSRTAVQIGQAVAYMAEDPAVAALLPPGLAAWNERLLFAAGHLRPWHLRLSRRPWYRRFVAFSERQTADGQILNVAVRKRFMDDEVRQALAEGATQVLVVGAGYDTLALRLALEHPDVLCVEVDHPATQARKRAALAELDVAPPNLALVGVDLAAASLAETLAALPAWRADRRSAVVAEGLLMYLDEAAVRTFLGDIRRSTAAGSRVLFTYMRLGSDGQIHVGRRGGLSRWYFVLRGEPLRWAVIPDALPGFLAAQGYRLLAGERLDLRRRYLEPAGLGDRPLGGVELMAAADVLAA